MDNFRYAPGMDRKPGERLRSIREERRLSMARLAERMSPPTSPSQINKLEKGEVEFTMEWARRLGAALGVNGHERKRGTAVRIIGVAGYYKSVVPDLIRICAPFRPVSGTDCLL